ncbi:hypothetical protein WT83_17295 [Burkholderia territorii]|uniref:Uncharacterized protein n=1 Tax=Burkholderia territorii TaxID=1503055 RepID=A0A108EMK3_9BURK|nr:hypothetical protein WS53_20220 [Burkholderia territorii]KWN14215.1 hypothetical protein WT83_17295 [Burkholderia territorii]
MPTLAPRIIDLMLVACEATHGALDKVNGAPIMRVPATPVRSNDICRSSHGSGCLMTDIG